MFLIVIPARSGSKGIKNKNIITVKGKPLIEYTIEFAKKLRLNGEIFVSTDSPKIAKIALDLGVECPFLRPKSLSTDLIGDMPVLRNSLMKLEKLMRKRFEYVIMLQPTSPIRNKVQVKDAIKCIKKNSFDSVISISSIPKKYHPYKQFELNKGKLRPFSTKSKEIIARQQLESSYIRNGIVYIFTRKFVLSSNSVFSENTGYTIVDDRYINIDTKRDLDDFENFLQNN
jgi:CMP-N,N'-diacetyllegionaminic acid synthase